MANTFTVKLESAAVEKRLAELARKVSNLRPLLVAIGERLKRATDDHFQRQSGPDGVPWEPLAESTKAKKTQAGKGGAKILSYSGQLRDTIHMRATDSSVTVGSVKSYAAIHQLGGRAGRGGGVPIPPRPFLGVGPEDEQEILQLTADFLER